MKDNHKSNMFCTSLSKLPVSIQLLQLLKYLWCSLPSKDTWITLFWRLVNRSVLRIKTDNFLSIQRLLLEEGAPLVIQTHYLQLTFLVSLCHLANISIKRSFLFLWFVFFSEKLLIQNCFAIEQMKRLNTASFFKKFDKRVTPYGIDHFQHWYHSRCWCNPSCCCPF